MKTRAARAGELGEERARVARGAPRARGTACCITFCVIVSCNVFVTSHLLELCNPMQHLRNVSILSAKIHRCNTHTKILRVADKLRLSQPGFETRLKDAYCTHIAMAFLVKRVKVVARTSIIFLVFSI